MKALNLIGTVIRKYSLSTQELAKYIQENVEYFFIKSENPKEEPSIYVYDSSKGYYLEVSDNEFKAYIKFFVPYQLVKMHEINEIFANIKADFKHRNYYELDNNEFLINFEDGVLDINTMELKKHSPEYLMTIQIPVKYRDIENCTDKPKVFHKYMNRLVNNDTEKYTYLMEYIRRCD